MTLETLLFLILFSAICGVIGQVIIGQRGGLLATIGVGFIGAIVGTWLAAVFGLPGLFMINIGAFSFPIIWCILGAALLMGIVSLFTRNYYIY